MFEKSLKQLQKQFKGKSRSEIVGSKIQDITNDLVISGFTNDELSLIAHAVQKDIKSLLEHRKKLLSDEIHSTIKAINRL